MTSFVRVAEIWVPDSDGYLLEFADGLYDEAPEFGTISRSMCFGRGEGLPGRVWEQGRPIVLKNLQDGYFQRAAAAKRAELACAVAFPVFFDDQLKSVVVLFCGSLAGMSGAIEIWHNDPRVTTDLRLVDGVYGAADAAFEAASRDATMPRGVGLPGLAWQRQRAVFMDGLSESTRFVRSEDVAATGIRSGFALPCPVPSADTYVLTFLCATSRPIARRIASWVEAAGGHALAQSWSSDAAGGEGPPEADTAVLQAFASGVARIGRGSAGEGSATIALPSGPLLAVPMAIDGTIVETIAIHL
jgi:hypothetical protein